MMMKSTFQSVAHHFAGVLHSMARPRQMNASAALMCPLVEGLHTDLGCPYSSNKYELGE